jgi:hypothetical protein
MHRDDAVPFLGVMRWKIWSRRMPALFTTMSMRPKWSIAACTIFCALAQVATLSEEISDCRHSAR